MADELARLAVEVEGAAEGGFPLDRKVLAALGFTFRGIRYWSSDNKTVFKGSPLLSTSLDAVVALIHERLPGWMWTVESDGCADVRPPESHETSEGWYGTAATPALGLLAATLRALASQEKADADA